MAQTTRTIDHQEIKEWIEARGGSPAVVEGTHDEFGSGILRVDFGDGEEDLEELSWEEFFRVFDINDLAFVYQEDTEAITDSYSCKFVARIDPEEGADLDSGMNDSGPDVSDEL